MKGTLSRVVAFVSKERCKTFPDRLCFCVLNKHGVVENSIAPFSRLVDSTTGTPAHWDSCTNQIWDSCTVQFSFLYTRITLYPYMDTVVVYRILIKYTTTNIADLHFCIWAAWVCRRKLKRIRSSKSNRCKKRKRKTESTRKGSLYIGNSLLYHTY